MSQAHTSINSASFSLSPLFVCLEKIGQIICFSLSVKAELFWQLGVSAEGGREKGFLLCPGLRKSVKSPQYLVGKVLGLDGR